MVTRVQAAAPAPDAPAADTAAPADLGDLADLAARADAVEGKPTEAATELQPADPSPADMRDEAREVVELAGELLLPFVAHRYGQPVADLYGPAQRGRIAAALARVAIKRGWTVAAFMDGWGPELALCAAIAAPVLPLVLAAAAPPPPATKPDQPAELPQQVADPMPAQHAGDDGRVL